MRVIISESKSVVPQTSPMQVMIQIIPMMILQIIMQIILM